MAGDARQAAQDRVSAPVPVRVGIPVVALGGALGALARWLVTDALPTSGGFPWTVFCINVAGSALLAALPAVTRVRRTPWLALLLGTGVLGGFTTMSAASVDTVRLLDAGSTATALLYAGGTLVAALAAVTVVDRLSTPDDRADFEREEGDA